MAELLVSKKADVDAKDKDGRTPLDFAADSDKTETAEALLGLGAKVNAKDNDGFTPLHFAAGKGQIKVVELLLAKGADLNAKDSLADVTALQLAVNNKQKEVADLLRKQTHKAEITCVLRNLKAQVNIAANGIKGDCRNYHGFDRAAG